MPSAVPWAGCWQASSMTPRKDPSHEHHPAHPARHRLRRADVRPDDHRHGPRLAAPPSPGTRQPARNQPATQPPDTTPEAVMFDVVIIGGGPAGLNAALMLGRVGRPVLLADNGQPRNAASAAVHGFLSRDGADPAEIHRTARTELARYPSIQARDTTVESAATTEGGFEVTLAGGTTAQARRLLLATGVTDKLPAIDGLAGLWGRGVYHCPYCHGWEARGQQVAVLGGDDHAAHLALNLARLGCDVMVCTNGPIQASDPARAALAARQIRICEDPVG